MTMPHLMNCAHTGDGWCLACVKELYDSKEHQMVCTQVKYGKVGTNIAATGGAVLLQVEAGEDESFQQVRATLTYEQAEQLILDLQARITQSKLNDKCKLSGK